jgi:hypothetical protein
MRRSNLGRIDGRKTSLAGLGVAISIRHGGCMKSERLLNGVLLMSGCLLLQSCGGFKAGEIGSSGGSASAASTNASGSLSMPSAATAAAQTTASSGATTITNATARNPASMGSASSETLQKPASSLTCQWSYSLRSAPQQGNELNVDVKYSPTSPNYMLSVFDPIRRSATPSQTLIASGVMKAVLVSNSATDGVAKYRLLVNIPVFQRLEKAFLPSIQFMDLNNPGGTYGLSVTDFVMMGQKNHSTLIPYAGSTIAVPNIPNGAIENAMSTDPVAYAPTGNTKSEVFPLVRSYDAALNKYGEPIGWSAAMDKEKLHSNSPDLNPSWMYEAGNDKAVAELLNPSFDFNCTSDL